MKYFATLILTLLFLSATNAQTRSNESIRERIKSLGSEGSITVSYDAGSNVTTMRAVSENFSNDEVKRAGVRAMNVAAGALYAGNGIDKATEPIMLSFWVLSSKPRFGEDHSLTITSGNETLSFGDARYVARARDGMEYLNFEITREQLRKIAKLSNVKMLIGQKEFNFTRPQLKLLADLYLVTGLSK